MPQRRADALTALVDAVTAKEPPPKPTTAPAPAPTSDTPPGSAPGQASAPTSDTPPDPAPGQAPGSGSWPGLAPGWNSGRLGDRTRVILVIRADDLTPPPDTPDSPDTPADDPAPSADDPAQPVPPRSWPPEEQLLRHPDQVMSTWITPNGPGTGLLSRATMLRELCDTTVQRLIVGPDSQPLDIGRATRTIPAHIRTALTVRDRGCVFPGCDRPPGWTEAHHIHQWAAGGETSVQNLALACSRHHHEIHTGAWTITMGPDGHPHVTRTHNQRRRQ